MITLFFSGSAIEEYNVADSSEEVRKCVVALNVHDFYGIRHLILHSATMDPLLFL